MSIRHAILGLLAEAPMHGYRLRQVFAQRVSPLWGLTTGQIYQSLGVLERAGFLESRNGRSGRRPARRIYSVTDRGRAELTAWLQETPSAGMPPFRDDLLIRLMFLRAGDVDPLRESLTRREREAMLLLARVTRLRGATPVSAATMDVRGLFLDGMTDTLEAHIKLLQRCREEVERWGRIPVTEAASPHAGPCSSEGAGRAPAVVSAREATSIAAGRAPDRSQATRSSPPIRKSWPRSDELVAAAVAPRLREKHIAVR